MGSRLTIAFPYAGDQIGGSVYSSQLLASTLKNRGHRILVLAHGPGATVTEARKLGLDVIMLPPLSRHASHARPHRFRPEQLLAYRTTTAELARHRPDIVHVNDLNMLRTWMLPVRASRAKLVVHWRSSYLKSWSVDAGLVLAHRVISVSQYSKDLLPAWSHGKTDVVYNPFNLFFDDSQRRQAQIDLRARLSLPANAAVIGIFGNHIVRKRTHILADILNEVRQTSDGRPVFGLACGERAEPYDTELEPKIQNYGLQSRLLMPGFVRPVEDWIGGCDLLLAPSVREPLARNVLEAHGIGVPTLVSRDGGLREWVEDGVNGDLLDPMDIGTWIERTRRRLDDAAGSRQIAEQAQQRMKQLTADNHTDRVERIYALALGAAPSLARGG